MARPLRPATSPGRTGAAPASPVRRKLVGAVRAACARLGLDEEDRHAVQQSVTGKASMTDMSIADLGALLSHLNRDWGGPQAKNPHLGKVKALWWTLYWLGAIDDPGDKPLSAFVRRQTGISALRFLDARSSPAVIEGLKGWAARQGVSWPTEQRLAEHRRYHNPDMSMALADRHAVILALDARLRAAGLIRVDAYDYLMTATGGVHNVYHWDAAHLDSCIRLLGRKLRGARTGGAQ